MRITVVGADGKMGQELLKLVEQSKAASLVGAIVQHGSAFEGQKVANFLKNSDNSLCFSCNPKEVFPNSDVVIDFTRPAGSLAYSALCADYGIAHIIGTTGFSKAETAQLESYAQKTIIVKSGNMSYGVNLLAALVKKAAQLLDAEDFDIEITEMHHRYKIDAPSGTALMLGEAAAQGRGKVLQDLAYFEHNENKPREQGSIGFTAQRGGTVIGDHHVIFAGDNERIVLSHMAQDRSIFALGALKAALWTRGKQPGLYSMNDVLGLT